VNTILPTVSGEARETETLTGKAGGWAGAPTRFSYEWLRCATPEGTDCTPIAGATALTYAPVHDDVGSTLRLRETATNTIGPTAAESAPTKIVQPLVVKAVLTISPTELCTGDAVQMDSTGSKTPDPPIVKYRYTYKNVHPFLFGEPDLSGPEMLLYEGTKTGFTQVFTWNRLTEPAIDGTLFGVGTPARDFVQIKLTVTDLAGHTASATSKILEFSPIYLSELEFPEYVFGCKFIGRPASSQLGWARTPLVTEDAVVVGTTCKSAVPCAGSLSVLRSAPRIARASSVLATLPFFTLAAHHSKKLRAKLTPAGRRLLRRGRAVPAIVRLTTFEAAEKRRTRSTHVVLKRR
jgi:hypothetical protein